MLYNAREHCPHYGLCDWRLLHLCSVSPRLLYPVALSVSSKIPRFFLDYLGRQS